MILSEWSGDVISTLHRVGITRVELAEESEIGVNYLSTILNQPYPAKSTCEKIDLGLVRCLTKRGLKRKYLYPSKDRSTEGCKEEFANEFFESLTD